MKKILIIQDINEKGKQLLTNHSDYEFEVIDDVNNPELKNKIVDCDGASLRTGKLPGEIIDLGKNLKLFLDTEWDTITLILKPVKKMELKLQLLQQQML